MEYKLSQYGRAKIDFLTDLRAISNSLETRTDQRARDHGLQEHSLPGDPETLQAQVAPILEADPDFRMLRLCRDWTLEQHGGIAMAAFDEVRAAIEPELQALQSGPTTLTPDDTLVPPDYWEGYEFHKSEGGWDGHDYMGFVHGELIHRRMVNPNFAGIIYAMRKSVADAAPVDNPQKILEVGCCSGQYTQGLAEVFPAAEIWACDLSLRQLEQAQRYANEQGLSWKLFQAAGERTRMDDGMFDLVTSYAMFHELPPEAALANLQEYHRVLKPGGCVTIGDIKAYRAYDHYERWKNDYWNQVHGGDPYWRDYATTDLAKVAKAAGFATATWEGLGEQQYPFVLIAHKGTAE